MAHDDFTVPTTDCSGMRHEEEAMILCSLLQSQLHPQMPQGDIMTTTSTMQRRQRRSKGGEPPKKRRLSEEQAKFLEARFGEEKRLEPERKAALAKEAGLDPKQIAVWFQNRRARHKGRQVAEAYLRLKSDHDAAVLEKCHLESEVQILKEKLLDAQDKMRGLSAAGQLSAAFGDAAGSPATVSSLTYQPLMANFGVASEEEVDELVRMQGGYDFNKYMMELGYFCGM